MPIRSLKKLCFELGIECSRDAPVNGFSVDSRLLAQGELFCALPGAKTDGAAFALEAERKGASAVLSDRPIPGVSFLILVPDVLQALHMLAAKLIKRVDPFTIAITGSVGKTTVKEWVATLLGGSQRSLFKTPGNANSQVGLPLALLNGLKGGEEVAILEMGMSKKGEIEKLVEIAPPTIAILNSVGYCHAENFSDLKGIAEAKAEIFSHPRTSFKLCNSHVKELLGSESLNCRFFGLQDECLPFSLLKTPEGYAFKEEQELALLPSLPFSEPHLLMNLLAAIAAARLAGLELSEIAERIPDLKVPEKRFQIVQKKGVILINDAYNACPLSVKAALDAMPAPQSGGKRVAVLGSMEELGAFSEACHREVGEYALGRVDRLYCIGEKTLPLCEEWKQAGKEAGYFESKEALFSRLKYELNAGDVLLVKGSNSHRLWEGMEEL